MSDCEYPEHEKLASVVTVRRSIQEFLEWLDEQAICLCDYTADEYESIDESDIQILHRFLGIDEDKLEPERQAMFAAIQANNSEKDLPEDDPSRILPL